MKSIKQYKQRQQWFLDRIGKRVFRETNGCSCGTCQRNTENGIVILDENHALYMCDCEAMSQIPEESNHPFKYRDDDTKN